MKETKETRIHPNRQAQAAHAINEMAIRASRKSLEAAQAEFDLATKLHDLAIAMRDRERLAQAESAIEFAGDNLAKAKRLHNDALQQSRTIRKNPESVKNIQRLVAVSGIVIKHTPSGTEVKITKIPQLPRQPVRHKPVPGAVTTKEQIREIILKHYKYSKEKIHNLSGKELINAVNTVSERIARFISKLNAEERGRGLDRTVWTSADVIRRYPAEINRVANSLKLNGVKSSLTKNWSQTMKPRIGTYVDRFGLKFSVLQITDSIINCQWLEIKNGKFSVKPEDWHKYAETAEFTGKSLAIARR